MIYLVGIVGSLTYILVGSWMWGYLCAHLAGEYNIKHGDYIIKYREPSYYHDEVRPVIMAVFWPCFAVSILVFGNMIRSLVAAGENKGLKVYQNRRLRIELERKFRIEQDRIEKESEEEIEEALLKDRSASTSVSKPR